MPSATSTVLVPGCFRMARIIPRTPSYQLAASISHDERSVGRGVRQLAGGQNSERLAGPVQPSGRKIRVRLLDGALHVVDPDAARREFLWVHLYTDRVFLR